MSNSRKRILIANLLGDPTLNHQQIAEMVGCSTKTVQRVRREVQLEAKQTEGAEDYLVRTQRLLSRRLSPDRCVDELAKLVEQDEHKPTKLNAIKRTQEIMGVVTEKEKRGRDEKQPYMGLMIVIESNNFFKDMLGRPNEPKPVEATLVEPEGEVEDSE